MTTQSKWLIFGLCSVLSLFAGVSFADDDGQSMHHGMMGQWQAGMHQDRDDAYPQGWGYQGEGHHWRGMRGDDDGWWSSLSDEQRKAIAASKQQIRKASENLRARMRVARAELALFNTEDKPDQAGVDAKIDEITQLINQQMKLRYAHRQEVRALLNEEQRLAYDASRQGRGCAKRGWHH